MKDVARQAGVSVCTVSLVLNGKYANRVAEATVHKVRRAAQELGYEQNSVALTLKTKRSHVLGFVSDEIAITPYASRILLGAQDAARRLGYMLLTVNTGNDDEVRDREIAMLRRYRVDGFLYALMYHKIVDVPRRLTDVPTVVVDGQDAAHMVPSAFPDDETVGFDATNRLIAAGCERIAYCGSEAPIVAQGERLAGYRRALSQSGIGVDESLIVNVTEEVNAVERMGRLFDTHRPDAVFCFNDRRAAAVYRAAAACGLRVGEDISVVSVDNQPFITNVLSPGLTTVELPHYDMGYVSVVKLVEALDGPEAVAEVLEESPQMRWPDDRWAYRIRCRIIERQSVRQ